MQTDAGDTVMDETEIELRDVTQYVMRPPHSFTSRCVSQSALIENCRRFAAGQPLLNPVDKEKWF